MKEISPDILILLRKHAKGELNDTERGDLDALLLEHPDLQEELEYTRALVHTTEQVERQRLLAMIESVEVQTDVPGLFQIFKRRVLEGWEQLTRAFSPPRKLVWATVVVLLLAAVGVWWSNWRTDALGEFQRTEYIPPAIASFKRGGAVNTISTAFRDYQLGDYRQSLAALSNVPPEDSLYLVGLLLQGHNYYLLGDYARAISIFDTLNLKKHKNEKYEMPDWDDANWTRILAMLSEYNIKKEEGKRKELEQNIQQFLKTANPADEYYGKAEALKSLLKEE